MTESITDFYGSCFTAFRHAKAIIREHIVEAISQRVDSAVIFGENRPFEWQNDIVTLARQAGNNVAPGSTPDYYAKILAEDGVFAKVEDDGCHSSDL